MKLLFALPVLGFVVIACKPQTTSESKENADMTVEHSAVVTPSQAAPAVVKEGTSTSEIPDELPDEDEPTPGERLDKAIEKTGESLQKAGEKTEEGMRKAGVKTGDALQRMGEKIERAAER